MSFPKVIAERGKDSRIFLVQTTERLAFVADEGEGIRWNEMNKDSVLARGYWEDPVNPPKAEDLVNLRNVSRFVGDGSEFEAVD